MQHVRFCHHFGEIIFHFKDKEIEHAILLQHLVKKLFKFKKYLKHDVALMMVMNLGRLRKSSLRTASPHEREASLLVMWAQFPNSWALQAASVGPRASSPGAHPASHYSHSVFYLHWSRLPCANPSLRQWVGRSQMVSCGTRNYTLLSSGHTIAACHAGNIFHVYSGIVT